MDYGKIGNFFKLRLAPFMVIVLGFSVLVGCVSHGEVESVINDPDISSELPPEAAVQYLNKLLSQNDLDNGVKCRVFTTRGVVLQSGITYN